MKHFYIIILSITFFSIHLSSIFSQQIIYVDQGVSTPGNGSSWSNAFDDLQDALAAAQSGDEVWVAEGTYYPTDISSDRDASFQLLNGVALYGGFTGDENFLSQRDWIAHETILSGDINQSDSLDGNSYTVVNGSGTDSTAIIDGFTITGGNADVISAPTIIPNQLGGGIYNNNGSPSITNCTISGNSAYNWGGGIFNYNSSPIITNSTISGNSTVVGGGIHNRENSYPTIINSTISSNQASARGGGIYNSNSSPTFSNSTISGNSTGVGGGIYNTNSNPTFLHSTISSNQAGFWGGGIYNTNSSPTFTNSIISENEADNWGGGIYNSVNSSPSITNSTISGNSATLGAGIWSGASTSPSITNSTISGNSASSQGGGIYNLSTSPTFTNSIIWNNSAGGNTSSTSASVFNSSSNPTFSFSLIANSGGSGSWESDIGQDLGNNIDADPLFLEDIDLDSIPTSSGDFQLQECSPAIDAGDNNALTAADSLDLDGNPRYHNPTGAHPAIVDMGSYEFQGSLGNANVIYVDSSNTTPGNGLSWDCAFTDLQQALNVAQVGDSIWVAAGTYFPTNNASDRNATFQLNNGVAMYGGFTGNETILSERDWENNQTTLSGDINQSGNLSGNSYTVVTGSGTDSTAIIDGFTITGGNADVTSGPFSNPNRSGGGIYNNNGSPTITNCTISGNLVNIRGGGISNLNNSSPTLTSSTISGNEAGFFGGGISNLNNSSPTITNSTISGNEAGFFGGGISNL
ncbi:MAG: hypothetical protein EA409_00480, partial [Saprospirales bacterium]